MQTFIIKIKNNKIIFKDKENKEQTREIAFISTEGFFDLLIQNIINGKIIKLEGFHNKYYNTGKAIENIVEIITVSNQEEKKKDNKLET